MKIAVVAVLAFALFYLQQLIYHKIWNRKLNVSVYFEESTLFAGQKGHLCEQIENAKYVSIPVLKAKFQCSRELKFEASDNASVTDLYYRNDMFSVKAMQKITRRLNFTAGKRGYYRIKSVDLIGSDFLLSSENISTYPVEAFLYVYPRPLTSPALKQMVRRLNAETVSRRNWREDPFQYRGIREYRPEDNMRKINWKATARTEEIKVNEKDDTTINSFRIFLCLDDVGMRKDTEMTEAAISLAAGAAEEFMHQNGMLSFYCSSKDCITGRILCFTDKAGESCMDSLYRMLARLDTTVEPDKFSIVFEKELLENTKESMAVFITVNLHKDITDVLKSYKCSGGEFCCLVPVQGKKYQKVPEDLQEDIHFVQIEG